ncbi:hypothetical protein AW168_39300 [Nocardia brasiliensis]|nr:hypothetical protein AW168_39300 [Nocardia brasiliensis]
MQADEVDIEVEVAQNTFFDVTVGGDDVEAMVERGPSGCDDLTADCGPVQSGVPIPLRDKSSQVWGPRLRSRLSRPSTGLRVWWGSMALPYAFPRCRR